jgi:hypothetical protein
VNRLDASGLRVRQFLKAIKLVEWHSSRTDRIGLPDRLGHVALREDYSFGRRGYANSKNWRRMHQR